MSMNAKQLLQYVIQPTLQFLGLDSPAAQNLLLGTCAQESQMGTYLKQINGPALGIYQMEPKTHFDVQAKYLVYHDDLLRKINSLVIINNQYSDRNNELIINLAYATAMCRVQYARFEEPLPHPDDVADLAHYWKTYWNTSRGDGTVQQFIDNYKRYVIL